MSSTSARRQTIKVGVATVIFAATMSGAGPASADTTATARNGDCETSEFCYYWGNLGGGSVSDHKGSTALGNYGSSQPGCYEFKGAGTGQDECIKNNAASAWNRTSATIRVYYNSNFKGAYQDIAPGRLVNLSDALFLNNASHKQLA